MAPDTLLRRRPILHPPIPSPYAGPDQAKIVYISRKTPFVSALKRVQKLISLAEKRLMGKFDLVNGEGKDKHKLKALGAIAPSKQQKEAEAVILKATNVAIEKALGLALFFQGQDGLTVQLRTGTVGVVDDIDQETQLAEGGDTEDKQAEMELPETQIRKISMLEVAIMLK